MRRTSLLSLAALVAFTFVAVPMLQAADSAKPEKKAEESPEQVRLYVEGAYCPGCAGVLREALEISGLKKPSKISANSGQGFVIVYGDFAHSSDLSKIALAVNGAQTPHKKISQPGVSLELFAKLSEDSGDKVLKALEKIKGVDAAGSTVNTKRGVISVRLAGGESVTVDGIIEALKKDGIEAKVETNKVKQFLVTPEESKEEKE